MVHVVADEKATKEFVLPVSWAVFSKISVQADSLEEAFAWAEEHLDDIPLDTECDYVDGSYELTADCPEECEIYNTSACKKE